MLDLSHPGSGEGTGHASVKPGAPARPGSLQVTDLGLDRQSVTTIPLATPTPSGNKGLRWAPSPNPSDSTDSSPRAASGPDSGLLTLTKTQMDGGGGVSELEQESEVRRWAADRQQALSRTVRGVMLYGQQLSPSE